MAKKNKAGKKTAAEIDAGKDKIDVQAATMVGDIRDKFLNIIKQHGEWKKLKEGQQKDIVAAAENVAKEVVRGVSDIVAGRGFKSISGTLEQVTVKDGLKLVIKASKMVDARRDLIDHQGGGITVVIKDINQYLGQRSEPEIDEDEPALPLERED